jgi:hypothetical protein
MVALMERKTAATGVKRTPGHVLRPDREDYWLVSHLVSMAVERTSVGHLAMIGATKSLLMGQTASEAKDLQHPVRAFRHPCRPSSVSRSLNLRAGV